MPNLVLSRSLIPSNNTMSDFTLIVGLAEESPAPTEAPAVVSAEVIIRDPPEVPAAASAEAPAEAPATATPMSIRGVPAEVPAAPAGDRALVAATMEYDFTLATIQAMLEPFRAEMAAAERAPTPIMEAEHVVPGAGTGAELRRMNAGVKRSTSEAGLPAAERD